MEFIKSIFYFILAGVFEIGGGYLVWLCLRDGKNFWYGITGAIVLIHEKYFYFMNLKPVIGD